MSTFEGYLKELKKKHPEGAKIVAIDPKNSRKAIRRETKIRSTTF